MPGYVPPPPPPKRRSYLMRFLGFAFATGVILFIVGASAAGIVLWSVTKELPLAAKEVSGTLTELQLMDKAFLDPSVLDRPVGEVMEPALPMVGIGEAVTDVVDHLDRAPGVLVLDGGHPIGVLTTQDVLGFLAARSPG